MLKLRTRVEKRLVEADVKLPSGELVIFEPDYAMYDPPRIALDADLYGADDLRHLGAALIELAGILDGDAAGEPEEDDEADCDDDEGLALVE